MVAKWYTGWCLSCHRDFSKELQRLQKVDPNAQGDDVVPLRGWQNRMDPCYRFPHNDLADLFAKATVTEARFIALEHMQIDFVTVSSTGLRKFRKNIISFPQSIDRAVRRHGLLREFRVGDRVNSRRGPGDDLGRGPVLADDASSEAQQNYATDKNGYLVFPATVTRVDGVERVFLRYDHAGEEEFCERVEWLEPRVQMPWHPEQFQGQFVIMLTQNVNHGDPIEGLEVRWGLVCKILKALTALPHLYPHVTNNLPWRFGGSIDEPMHRWYDTKHGMFDVLDEADMRRYYAPKKWEGGLLSPVEAAEPRVAAAVEGPGIDLRSAADMLAAGLDVRFDAGGGVPGDGSGVDVVAEEDFGAWLTLRDLDLASQLASFWRNMDIRPDGEVVQSMKESDAETDVAFFRKL